MTLQSPFSTTARISERAIVAHEMFQYHTVDVDLSNNRGRACDEMTCYKNLWITCSCSAIRIYCNMFAYFREAPGQHEIRYACAIIAQHILPAFPAFPAPLTLQQEKFVVLSPVFNVKVLYRPKCCRKALLACRIGIRVTSFFNSGRTVVFTSYCIDIPWSLSQPVT